MHVPRVHRAQFYLFFFNLLWTSLLPIVTGVLDQDIDAAVLLAYPKLYEVVRVPSISTLYLTHRRA
jgi:hypothetical protein